ncbi:MAG: hypothetical protein VX230_02735, partial [Candidatus Thermoplasmatota archaeon]|nr:hypothetical protein [Candidatus Thermoplasmatota archaeon]
MNDGRTERDPHILPFAAQFMQPGAPIGIPHGMMLVSPEPAPLTPPPSNLQMARPSRPWRMYGRVVGLVVLLFFFEQIVAGGWIWALEG